MQSRSRFLAALCAGMLLVCLIGAAVLYAADTTDAGAAPPQAKKSMADMLKAGGIIGHCIILINIAAVAIAIETFMTLQRNKMCPPEIVGELEALLEEENYEEALALCDSHKTFLTSVMAAGLARIGLGFSEMRNSMQEAGDLAAMNMNNKINWLSLLYSVGPMLGLLGTVTGMIGAFQVIENTANPSPALLAKGIYEALVTTVEGLVVALPTLTIYFYFKARLGRLLAEVGMVTEELTERFRQPAQ